MSAANTIIGPVSGLGSGVFPSLIFVHGTEQRTLYLDHSPFSVGRKMEKDLVIPDPRVSRDHALIVSENGKFFVEDQGSKHGTFVNGEKVQRRVLERNDRLEFGAYMASAQDGVRARLPGGPQVAILAVPPIMDPGRFTQAVANNRGVRMLASDSLEELRSWLGV